MKKISLLPLLFSLSFSVAYGAQTQEANEQDNTNSPQIETQNKDTYTPLPNPIKDTIRHYGYFFSTVIAEAVLFFVMCKKLDNYSIATRFCTRLFVFMLISYGIPYFSEDIGKVDHYSNPLTFEQSTSRVILFLFIPYLFKLFLIYYFDIDNKIAYNISKRGKDFLNFNTKIYIILQIIIAPILLDIIYFLIAWCIDRFIFSSSETDKENEVKDIV